MIVKQNSIGKANLVVKSFNWNSAKKYCSNLTYGGKSDWETTQIYMSFKSLVDL